MSRYTTADRKAGPGEVARPCEDAAGEVRQDHCPFGGFVELFPLRSDDWAAAEAHGRWMVAVYNDTGLPVPALTPLPTRQFRWVAVTERPEDGHSVPNSGAMELEGLVVPSGHACPVFGHDCPAYYGFTEVPS